MSNKTKDTEIFEKTIGNKMCEFVQSIWDKYHICIKDAKFSWRDESSIDKPSMVVTGVMTTMEMDKSRQLDEEYLKNLKP